MDEHLNETMLINLESTAEMNTIPRSVDWRYVGILSCGLN